MKTNSRAARAERTVDLLEIDPTIRLTIVMQLLDHLDPAEGLRLIVDHKPMRLLNFLSAGDADRFQWTYLEQGPPRWVLQIVRKGECDAGPSVD